MISALLAYTGSGFASDLPDCHLSGYKPNYFGSISVVVGTYVGEFKDGKLNGYAIWYSPNGSILKEGIWKNDEFLYAKKVTLPVVERDEPQLTIDKVAESYKAQDFIKGFSDAQVLAVQGKADAQFYLGKIAEG